MYNKQEASAVRQKFWTQFGQYMSPVPSASGEKVNWVNYKTGIKGISFRSDADNNQAYTAVEISVPDKMLQHRYFDIFRTFKKQFEAVAGKDWEMRAESTGTGGNEMSSIRVELNNINIFRESDRPAIVSFLKQNIIALDAFWSEYKPAFEMIH